MSNLENKVLDVLRSSGACVDEISGAKHCKIFWTLNGRKMITTMARTPSDPRTITNTLALVRRQIRQANGAAAP